MKTKHKKLKQLKYIPTGSNWKKVLLEVYRYSPHNYGESHKAGFYDDNHYLVKKLKITDYELGLAVSFLREHNLVKNSNLGGVGLNAEPICPEWSNNLILTKRGFDVAIKLENQISNKKSQDAIVLFMSIATLIALMSLINNIYPEYTKLILVIFFISVSFAVFWVVLFDKICKRWKRFIFKMQVKSGEYGI